MILKPAVFIFSILLLNSAFSQVNLQTGSAVFSFPLFQWQDDKSRLANSISLDYSSGSGLKVNDIASNVGQGWDFMAGGVITRIQAGEPDDQLAFNGIGDHSDQDVSKYPAGYLYAGTPAVNGCPLALTTYPLYGWKNQVYVQHNSTAQDKQLDYFSFKFNGKGGLFVLDVTNGDHGSLLGDDKMKISFQRDASMANNTSSGIRTTITSFTIQDVSGMIYKFSQHGLSKLLHVAYCDAGGTWKMDQPNLS